MNPYDCDCNQNFSASPKPVRSAPPRPVKAHPVAPPRPMHPSHPMSPKHQLHIVPKHMVHRLTGGRQMVFNDYASLSDFSATVISPQVAAMAIARKIPVATLPAKVVAAKAVAVQKATPVTAAQARAVATAAAQQAAAAKQGATIVFNQAQQDLVQYNKLATLAAKQDFLATLSEERNNNVTQLLRQSNQSTQARQAETQANALAIQQQRNAAQQAVLEVRSQAQIDSAKAAAAVAAGRADWQLQNQAQNTAAVLAKQQAAIDFRAQKDARVQSKILESTPGASNPLPSTDTFQIPQSATVNGLPNPAYIAPAPTNVPPGYVLDAGTGQVIPQYQPQYPQYQQPQYQQPQYQPQYPPQYQQPQYPSVYQQPNPPIYPMPQAPQQFYPPDAGQYQPDPYNPQQIQAPQYQYDPNSGSYIDPNNAEVYTPQAQQVLEDDAESGDVWGSMAALDSFAAFDDNAITAVGDPLRLTPTVSLAPSGGVVYNTPFTLGPTAPNPMTSVPSTGSSGGGGLNSFLTGLAGLVTAGGQVYTQAKYPAKTPAGSPAPVSRQPASASVAPIFIAGIALVGLVMLLKKK